jgi:hypothetical protein
MRRSPTLMRLYSPRRFHHVLYDILTDVASHVRAHYVEKRRWKPANHLGGRTGLAFAAGARCPAMPWPCDRWHPSPVRRHSKSHSRASLALLLRSAEPVSHPVIRSDTDTLSRDSPAVTDVIAVYERPVLRGRRAAILRSDVHCLLCREAGGLI